MKSKSTLESLNQIKTLTLKNYQIGLLKKERTFLSDKESQITLALKHSERKLDNDYKSFQDFIEKEKKLSKQREQVVKLNFRNIYNLLNIITENLLIQITGFSMKTNKKQMTLKGLLNRF
jgi:hypothetical protein